MSDLVQLFYGKENQIPSEIIDNNIYYTTDTNKLVFDINSQRYKFGNNNIVTIQLVPQANKTNYSFYLDEIEQTDYPIMALVPSSNSDLARKQLSDWSSINSVVTFDGKIEFEFSRPINNTLTIIIKK